MKEEMRALEVIARIAMNTNPDETDEAWNKVYMLAHSFSATCTGHDNWRAKLPELEKETKNY